MLTVTENTVSCFHCGEECAGSRIRLPEKVFCCEGCKMVYSLLNEHGLCTYYDLNASPGKSLRNGSRRDQFAFLDDTKVEARLVHYQDSTQTHVRFYIPMVHCSSCLYLLEQLHQLKEGIKSSKLDFGKKELTVIFDPQQISLREVAELLADTGYEPHFSMEQLQVKQAPVNRSMITHLGVAGFCFGNIMLLSFPEYLGLEGTEGSLRTAFHVLSLLLSLPVMFYAARPFYQSAWQGIRHRYLNIDAPIVLAILITFGRSLAEILSGHSAGYLDSLSGIVFFMLVGRVLQDRTYRRLSFDRDFSSYFPLAVSVLKDEKVVPTSLPQLKTGDTVLIHHQELIPADGILIRGKAMIDYSFVTGESVPVPKMPGEILYAGGRQTGTNIEVLLIKGVAQSYLTSLWSRSNEKNKQGQPVYYVHMLSRYFTYIVLALATGAGIYWGYRDPSRVGQVVTGILIIACPCALLLSSNFTHSNILRILARNRFYLRDALAIEAMARIDHIVVDKTGTLTIPGDCEVSYQGESLSPFQRQCIAAAAAQSVHPLSRALANYTGPATKEGLESFREWPGMGIEAQFGAHRLRLGSHAFIKGADCDHSPSSEVVVEWDREKVGKFKILSRYRKYMAGLSSQLQARYILSLLSGDNDSDKNRLQEMMGAGITMRFSQQPGDKLAYIKALQQNGHRVMMIGDGLNDGPALRQSHAGIAIAEDCNNFTPASDGILEASGLHRLPDLLRLCRISRKIVMGCFLFSILYNLIGLYFAVRGELAPLTAAILMPASTISILVISMGSSNLIARSLRL